MGPSGSVLQSYPRAAKARSSGPKSRFCSARPRNIPRFPGRNLRPHQRIVVPIVGLQTEVLIMLSWVLTFLVIALIAGILGFGGIAGASVEIAKIIFFIAVVLFLISAVTGIVRGRSRV